MTNLPPSKEYIHSLSKGNLSECKLKAQELIKLLKELYDVKKILGWETLIIKNEDMIEDNYILTNPSKIVNYEYPYLFLVIQHGQEEYLDISNWVNNNGFVEVKE